MTQSIFTPNDSIITREHSPALSDLSLPARTSSPFRKQGPSEHRRHHHSRSEPQSSKLSSPLDADSNLNSNISEDQCSPSIWTPFAEPPPSISPCPNSSHAQSPATAPNASLQSSRTPLSVASQSTRSKRKLAWESLQGDQSPGPTSQPASKRQRVPPRTKHTLSSHNFGGLVEFGLAAAEPPSPLFFSNSPRPRPVLPPRFSSGEAAARMMSKARSEESNVRTVSLARGTVTSPASALGGPTSAPHSSRRSLERGLTARSASPDTNSHGSREGSYGVGNVLHSIGILELLEQDERPTFIVDLGERQNYGPGPLHLLFANMSLRSYEGMQALVAGTSSPEAVSPGVKTFLHFKSWLLSAAINGESLNVCLPPFNYANLTWSCSTLRKHLRIISGAFISLPSDSAAAVRVSVPPAASQSDTKDDTVPSEPGDYFEQIAASSKVSSGASSGSNADIMSTIEEHEPSSIVPEFSGQARIAVPPGLDLQPVTDLLPSATAYVPSTVTPGSIASNGAWQENYLANEDASARSIDVVPGNSACFDWTRLPLSTSMPEHIQFARSVDWASTSLGPIESWSSDLRQMCNLIMASPHPAAMYWGEDLVAIYNEAYVMLAGQKHPALMGMT